MKFPYDTGYFPPAPSLEIWLAAPGEAFTLGPLRALMDTGADLTLIPIEHVRRLQTPEDDRRHIRSHWGERREVALHSVDIGIGALRLPAVEIVADEGGTEIILGRNVLNQLIVTLNGPKRELEISG